MAHLTTARKEAILIARFTGLPDGCMTAETVAELDRLLGEAERDSNIAAIVFAGGIPGIFIRHYSVGELAEMSNQLRQRGIRFSLDRIAPEKGFPAVARRMEELSKPVIAAIDGLCMGGGFEFALACDLRIAAAGRYALGLPEVNIGLLPGGGGTQKLPRLVGVAKALEMMMLGRTVTPDEALRLGIVHEVVPDALARATDIAAELARKSPLALAHIKRLVRAAAGAPDAAALGHERTLFMDLLVSDDANRLMTRMNSTSGDIRNASD